MAKASQLIFELTWSYSVLAELGDIIAQRAARQKRGHKKSVTSHTLHPELCTVHCFIHFNKQFANFKWKTFCSLEFPLSSAAFFFPEPFY